MLRNLAEYGPFAASERVLMALGKAGADRQAMHERLRQHALDAWEALRAGQPNPLNAIIAGDPEIRRYLSDADLSTSMEAIHHLGDASQRARLLAIELRGALIGN
jgi:adenylosuccinate lyase